MAVKKKVIRAAPKKKPVVKKPAVKKPAVKKPAVKKPAVKKPAVKKAAPTSVKKAVKKAPAKKAPAKKAAAASTAVPRKRATVGRKAAPLKSKRPSTKAAAPKKRVLAVSRSSVPENREALALAHAIATVALDKKATDVVILDVRARGASVGYDYLVLASGDSDVQLDAIKNGVADAVGATQRKPSSVESAPDWVLVNFDDVVAHFFTPEKRQMYDLEGLWSDAERIAVG